MPTIELSTTNARASRCAWWRGLSSMTARGSGLDDGAPVVEGSDDLVANVALVTLVLGYAANELAYRRSDRPRSGRVTARRPRASGRMRSRCADLVVRLGERTVLWLVLGLLRTRPTIATSWARTVRADLTSARTAARRPSSVLVPSVCPPGRDEAACSGLALLLRRAPARDPRLREARRPRSRRWPTRGLPRYEVAQRCTDTRRSPAGTIGAAAVVAPMALLAAPVVWRGARQLRAGRLADRRCGADQPRPRHAWRWAIASGGLGMAGGTVVVTATGTAHRWRARCPEHRCRPTHPRPVVPQSSSVRPASGHRSCSPPGS